MSLSDLKFSDSKRPPSIFRANAVEKARIVALSNISIQKLLLKGELGEPVHITKTIKKKVDNETVETVVTKNPRKWFWKDHRGVYLLEMLYGSRAVSINGKSTIEAGPTPESVEKVLDILANSVSVGELDRALSDTVTKRKTGGRKKSA